MLNSAQMRDLIENYGIYGFSLLLIVDARFGYEHDGGHIKKSQNIRSLAQMQILFQEFRDCEACVVFHCEFSQKRGPNLMHRFRDHDRCANSNRYPKLNYPTIYLLQGGYSKFFGDCPDLCEGGYVSMCDPRFTKNGELKRSYSLYAAGGLCGGAHQPRLRRSHSNCDAVLPFEYDYRKPEPDPFAEILDL
jgi:M-phase inducer tyrosine phosphatase